MDPMEKAKQAMGGLERAISGLPGIEGYREKDMRRSADKQVRENLALKLEEQRRQLTGLQQDLLNAGGLLWMDDMERAVGRLQLFIDRVKTASYGYAPFFDIQRVKEAEIERLIEFDKALFDALPPLEQAVGALATAIGANDKIGEALRTVADLLAGMNTTFGRRGDVFQETA